MHHFLGQTPLKTGRVINSALGGVLFVDEAYSLAQSQGATGAEVISTLIKAMEDNKGNLVINPTGEIEHLLQTNKVFNAKVNQIKDYINHMK